MAAAAAVPTSATAYRFIIWQDTEQPFRYMPVCGMPGKDFMDLWESLSDTERRSRPEFHSEKWHYLMAKCMRDYHDLVRIDPEEQRIEAEHIAEMEAARLAFKARHGL